MVGQVNGQGAVKSNTGAVLANAITRHATRKHRSGNDRGQNAPRIDNDRNAQRLQTRRANGTNAAAQAPATQVAPTQRDANPPISAPAPTANPTGSNANPASTLQGQNDNAGIDLHA